MSMRDQNEFQSYRSEPYISVRDYTAIPDSLIDLTRDYFMRTYGSVWGSYVQLVNLAFINRSMYTNNIQQQEEQEQEQEQEPKQVEDDDFPYLPPGFSFEDFADVHQWTQLIL